MNPVILTNHLGMIFLGIGYVLSYSDRNTSATMGVFPTCETSIFLPVMFWSNAAKKCACATSRTSTKARYISGTPKRYLPLRSDRIISTLAPSIRVDKDGPRTKPGFRTIRSQWEFSAIFHAVFSAIVLEY